MCVGVVLVVIGVHTYVHTYMCISIGTDVHTHLVKISCHFSPVSSHGLPPLHGLRYVPHQEIAQTRWVGGNGVTSPRMQWLESWVSH